MSSFADRPRRAIAALVLCFALVEFLFRAPLLLGAVALYQRDLLLLYFPLVQAALRGLSEGALPLRDPTSAFGQPLLADPSCQVLYPPVALYLLLPPHLAYAWFVSIHSVFGALGVALLARRFAAGSWLAALVAGLAWLVSGPLLSLATLWHHLSGAAWIPWVLLCVLRVTEGTHRRSGLVLGAVFGAQILAGSADMCAMTIFLSALFVAPTNYLRFRTVWFTSALIALSLSAGAWAPAAELIRNSARAALPEATRTFWSLHPLIAIEFFLPIPMTGIPLLPEWQALLFEGREPFLGSMFLGTAILPLCLAGFADPIVARRSRLACFLGIAGGFLIALGKHASAYGWVVALLPPLKILRFPSKAMIPVAILICVVAGVGASAIPRSVRARIAALVGIIVLAAAALILMSGPALDLITRVFLDRSDGLMTAVFLTVVPSRLLGSVVLLMLLAACLRWPFGRRGILFLTVLIGAHLRQSHQQHTDFNGTVPTAIMNYRPDHLSVVRPPDEGRLYVYDYQLFEGRAKRYLGEGAGVPTNVPGLPIDSARVVQSRAYLTPLVGAYWGIEYAWDGDLRLLFDRRLASLNRGLRRVEGTPGLLKLLQISGVTRVAALHEKGMDGLRPLARLKVFPPQDLQVFEVPDARPRVYLTTRRIRRTASDLEDLLNPGFDPAQSVLVDEGPAREASPGFAGRAEIVNRRADRLLIETTSNAPAFLTAIEGFMPGWRAYVDGKPARLERANAIFVGTEVPAGSHRVEFRFLPTSAVVGLFLSGLTALFLFVSLLRTRQADAA